MCFEAIAIAAAYTIMNLCSRELISAVKWMCTTLKSSMELILGLLLYYSLELALRLPVDYSLAHLPCDEWGISQTCYYEIIIRSWHANLHCLTRAWNKTSSCLQSSSNYYFIMNWMKYILTDTLLLNHQELMSCGVFVVFAPSAGSFCEFAGLLQEMEEDRMMLVSYYHFLLTLFKDSVPCLYVSHFSINY